MSTPGITEIHAAIHELQDLLSSYPYTAPEMLEHKVQVSTARVMNLLDPEGKLIQPKENPVPQPKLKEFLVGDNDLKLKIKPGDTFVVSHDGEKWEVAILDEELHQSIAPKFEVSQVSERLLIMTEKGVQS